MVFLNFCDFINKEIIGLEVEFTKFISGAPKTKKRKGIEKKSDLRIYSIDGN